MGAGELITLTGEWVPPPSTRNSVRPSDRPANPLNGVRLPVGWPAVVLRLIKNRWSVYRSSR